MVGSGPESVNKARLGYHQSMQASSPGAEIAPSPALGRCPADAPGALELDPLRIATNHRLDPRIPAAVAGFDRPFFQAGLAGYSDSAMRRVARALGSPLCVTEAILDRAIIEPGWKLDLADLFAADGSDLPLAVQLIGSLPEEMAGAAAQVVELAERRLGSAMRRRLVIDVNLACPVRKVARKRRGGHWLAAPDGAIELLRAVRGALPPDQTCTVKLRRGSDDGPSAEADFLRVFEATYELGYAWATVHARSVEQAYRGPSQWRFLQRLVSRYPDRLIFGSGDVWTAEDIFRMLDWTGVAGVSVARGSIGNPWIFKQAAQLMAGEAPAAPDLTEQGRVLALHLDLALELKGERAGSRHMRKIAGSYAGHHPEPARLRSEMYQAADRSAWLAILERWYPG